MKAQIARRRFAAQIAIGAAMASFAFMGTALADSDNYSEVATVNVGAHAITCFAADVSNFSFDISLVDAALGKYLLADSSHGRPSTDNQGGVLANATDGDVLVIDVDTKAVSTILPPKNDPFAGRRCDVNTNFGGVPGNPSRNEISGPNGALLVNDTHVWVGDGPSRFNPGQTNSAADYKKDPCDSSVRVFSLLTGEQTDHINLGGCFRTDEGTFDPVDQVVLIANPSEVPSVAAIDPHATRLNKSPFISLISARRDNDGDHDYDVLKQINFDGTHGTVNAIGVGIEQTVYDRQSGLFYVAIPGSNVAGVDGWLSVVDPVKLEVVNNIALHAGCAPTGNALGPNETLILGCGPAQAYDIKTGTQIAIAGAPGAPACDEVTYDAGSGHFGSACITFTSAGKFDLLVSDAHTLTFDLDLGTLAAHPGGASGAHSVAADPVTATFWFPAYQPPNQANGPCSGPGVACVGVYGGDDSDAQGN